MKNSPERPRAATAAAARRVLLGFGMREIGVGVIALGVLALAGFWVRGQLKGNDDEAAGIRAVLAVREDATEVYRERFRALVVEAERARAWADAQTSEPLRTWARERARRLEALAGAVNQEREVRLFSSMAKEIAELAAHGEIDAAKSRLMHLPAPTFPVSSELARLRERLVARPLAEFSRQNPPLYRLLRQFEPEIARADEAELRAELRAADPDNVTPQVMLKVDLLASVAPADDPIVSEWSAMTAAVDYFENPDGATLLRWRRAQRAMAAGEWEMARTEMQAIVKANVRTRQPFRAVLGRALLRSRPDAPGDAYPFLAEAAAAGDRKARAWVGSEDLRQKRYTQAQRWLEEAAAEGDSTAVPALLSLYRDHEGELSPDLARRIGVLERVTDRAEGGPDAWLTLGRLYERTDPPGAKAKAFACYSRAASSGAAAGHLEVARCALQGIGTRVDPDQARDAAAEAFRNGEREPAAEVLAELMRRVPERVAGKVTVLLGQESIAGAGGYTEARTIEGPGVSQLRAVLAKYLDQIGQYGKAAQLYARSADPEARRRHSELTAVHACEECGGAGKVEEPSPCPTCGGKGKQLCSYCGGSGTTLMPGAPPCSACAGTGTVRQDRRLAACGTCSGTGKGSGSVTKQDCAQCEHGQVRCVACTNGTIRVTKDCPKCRGKGAWTLVGQGE